MESTAVNGYVELEPLFVVDELETVGLYAKAPFAFDPGSMATSLVAQEVYRIPTMFPRLDARRSQRPCPST